MRFELSEKQHTEKSSHSCRKEMTKSGYLTYRIAADKDNYGLLLQYIGHFEN